LTHPCIQYGANSKIVGKTEPQNLSYAGAFQPVKGSLGDLAAHIGKGYPWMPAILDKGARRYQQHANYAELLAVDIDKGMSIDQALQHPFIAAHCGLAIESSSSSPEQHKFRLVFRLPQAITDWRLIRACNQYLIELLGVADRSCKDASRFFFGGLNRSPFLLNEAAMLPADFIEKVKERLEQDERDRAEREKLQSLKREQLQQRAEAEGWNTDDLIQQALSFIPPRSPGSNNYQECLTVLMALNSHYGAIEAERIGESWSPSIPGTTWDVGRKIRSFKAGKGVSIGSLFHIAQQHGFKFPAPKLRQRVNSAGRSDSPDKPEINHLQNRLTRQPDLNIGNKEFSDSECLAAARDKPFVVFWGGKGTAKSRAIGELLGTGKWLSITHLQSLGRDQAGGWRGLFVNDSASSRDWFAAAGISVCVPSLLTTSGLDISTLVMDEPSATLKFLEISKLANREGIRPLLNDELERRIRETATFYVADADLTEDLLTHLEQVRGQKAFLIKSDRQPLKWQANVIEGKQKVAGAEFLQRIETLPAGKIAFFNSDDKSLVNDLSKVLESKGIKTLTITQETSGDVQQQSFLNSKGRYLPTLLNQGVRAILTSPSVCQGFSIQNNTELIDSVWGIYRGVSIDASSVAQSLDRVRSDAPRYLWIAERGRAYSPFSKATDKQIFLQDFIEGRSKTAQIARFSLRRETVAGVDALDWQNAHINLLADFEVQRNRDMVAFKPAVVALLMREGKVIKAFAPQADAGKVKQFSDALKAARDIVNQQRIDGINTAIELTEQEAEKLERQSQRQPLTQSEAYALERYYLCKFYRLQDDQIETELIEFDCKGVTRQAIKNLETVLDKSVAVDRTVKSIDLNPSTPQDWSKAALQEELLRQSGTTTFIKAIWDGEVYQIEKDTIKPIVAELRRRAGDFKVAFSFSRLDAKGHDGSYLVSDQQIIALLLDWCGIKRMVDRKRTNGRAARTYRVAVDHLQKLKSIIQRRFDAVSPPLIENQYRGGDTPDVEADWLTAESLMDVQEWLQLASEFPNDESIAQLLNSVPPAVLKEALAV
jgi:hypothetical protein